MPHTTGKLNAHTCMQCSSCTRNCTLTDVLEHRDSLKLWDNAYTLWTDGGERGAWRDGAVARDGRGGGGVRVGVGRDGEGP